MPTPGRRGNTVAGSTPPASTPPANAQKKRKGKQPSQPSQIMTRTATGSVLKKVQKFTPPRQVKK